VTKIWKIQFEHNSLVQTNLWIYSQLFDDLEIQNRNHILEVFGITLTFTFCSFVKGIIYFLSPCHALGLVVGLLPGFGPTLVIGPRLELWTPFDLIFYLILSYVTLMHEQKKHYNLMFAQFLCKVYPYAQQNISTKTNKIGYGNYFPLFSYHWLINVLKVWPVHMD
jgi:uncharacterized membrane protein